MFKEQFYNKTIKFKVGATEYEYQIDTLTITLRKIQKRRELADRSIVRFLEGYHLDISLQWQWFKAEAGTAVTNDILFLYRTLLDDNSIIFIPNPDDTSPLEITVRDSSDQFGIVDIRDKIRQGSFSLELETIDMITDLTYINPLGFELL